MHQIAQLTRNLQAAGYFTNNEQIQNPKNQPIYTGYQLIQASGVCYVCQKTGELLCCCTCNKPYHLMCAKLTQLPMSRWECEECTIVARDNLIRELKENAHRKAQERERRKEEERLAKNEARIRRENEIKTRREEKERQKEEQRKQRAEQNAQMISQRREEAQKFKNNVLQQIDQEQTIDPETGQPYEVQGPLKIGQERQELLQLVALLSKPTTQKHQMVFGPDGSLISTILPQNLIKKKKAEHELTQEEKSRIERNRLIKQQLQIFTNAYPELVDRNSIKYPIKDELLLKLPELHGCSLEPKPEPFKILVSSDEFEKLIYIWEFCNNFSEYLDTPIFKLEELKFALQYTDQEDPNLNLSFKEEDQLEWNEQMRVKHIKEKGFHMINSIHTALANCFLDDFFPESGNEENQSGTNTRLATQAPVQLVSAQSDKENQILQAIDKLIENKEEVWPEIIRLILNYKKEQDDEDFGPNKETIDVVLQKLVGMRPSQYFTRLTFEEKICLLTVMIDGIHDTDDFRKFLNERVEEKSSFNKEKIEVYQAIRQLEQEQQELVKKHAESNFVSNEEEINKQLAELNSQLKVASRIQGRDIKERIYSLEAEKNLFLNENSRLDEQIKKRQTQIVKLNEKLYKSSIKTTMLGQDAQRSEYWHFKDDSNRIYIRKEEILSKVKEVDMCQSNASDQQVQADTVPSEIHYQWYYYENEEQLDLLVERLNTKGVRERRLQESLRKVKDILKLKKSKKVKNVENSSEKNLQASVAKSEYSAANKPDEIMQENQEIEEKAEQQSSKNEEMEYSESCLAEVKHVMFDTDNYKNCMLTAVWFGKKVPPKRRLYGRGISSLKNELQTEFGENQVNLLDCLNLLVRIQNLYTESSKVHEREWAESSERETWQKSVLDAKNCSEIVDLLIKLDDSMSQPFYLAQRGNSGQTQRLKLQLFKFWPSTDLRQAWRKYAEDLNSLKSENLNAFFIILRILERINEQFMIRQNQKMEKKNKAAIIALNSVNDPKTTTNTAFVNSQRNRQGQKDVNYVKYFESSESDYEEDEKSKKVKSQKRSDSDKESEEGSDVSNADETLGGKSTISARQQRALKFKEARNFSKHAKKRANQGLSLKRKAVDSVSEDSSSSKQLSENESSEEKKFALRGRGQTRGATSIKGRSRGTRARGRGDRPISSRESGIKYGKRSNNDSEAESQSEDSSEQRDTSREWEEYCYICQDGGSVLCCDGCSQVAHLSCLKLKSEPTGDWHCADCLKKMTMKRLTRNMETQHDKKSNLHYDVTTAKNGTKSNKAMRRF